VCGRPPSERPAGRGARRAGVCGDEERDCGGEKREEEEEEEEEEEKVVAFEE